MRTMSAKAHDILHDELVIVLIVCQLLAVVLQTNTGKLAVGPVHHRKHKCPECLLAKSFQTSLAVDGLFDIGYFSKTQIYLFTKTEAVQSILSTHYEARAPPAFLI